MLTDRQTDVQKIMFFLYFLKTIFSKGQKKQIKKK